MFALHFRLNKEVCGRQRGQGFSGSNEDRIGDLKNSAFGENLKAPSFFNLEN